MNDWKEKNESFKMTDEIRTLVPNEINTCLVFSQRVHNIVVGEEEKIPDFIGKPFSDPFEVIVFHKLLLHIAMEIIIYLFQVGKKEMEIL